jgi:hypothetical protein
MFKLEQMSRQTVERMNMEKSGQSILADGSRAKASSTQVSVVLPAA